MSLLVRAFFSMELGLRLHAELRAAQVQHAQQLRGARPGRSPLEPFRLGCCALGYRGHVAYLQGPSLPSHRNHLEYKSLLPFLLYETCL